MRTLLAVLLLLSAAAGEDLDVARERIDNGDPEGREACLRVIEERPSEMRAWVELYRGAVAPRDRDVLDHAARVRSAWARRAKGESGPIVAEALELLLARTQRGHVEIVIVVGLEESQGSSDPGRAAADALVRRAERIDASGPWVVYARFLADHAAWRGEDAKRRIATLASPVFAALARDPDNVVLLEALSLLPESPERRRATERLLDVAAAAHPRLLPGFRMAAVSWVEGRTDAEALERLYRVTREEMPDSLYLDDMAYRLGEVFQRQRSDPAAARRWYEEAVAIDCGNSLDPALLALAGLLEEAFDEPALAVERLRAYHDRRLSSPEDPVVAATPPNVLFRIGEIQRGRLHAPREAAETFLEGLAEARATGRERSSYAYYYLAAGDCLAEAGDHRRAMALYGQYQAEAEAPGHELWGRWLSCYLQVSPYFTISMGLTALLTALSGVLAVVLLVSRWTRARGYLGMAVVLTLLVGGVQVVVHGVALRVPASDLLWTGLLSLRTFLLVPAGMMLAAAVGVRTPRTRGAARSVLAGILAAVAMGAVTWALFRWRQPHPSELLQFLWDPLREGELGAVLEPSRNPLAAVLLVMTAGVTEELTCRLFFLGLLVRSLRAVPGRWAVSIALVSLFWAIAHAGMVEPESWKLAQVSALGVILGVLARREGILACVVAHAAFNAVGVWV